MQTGSGIVWYSGATRR